MAQDLKISEIPTYSIGGTNAQESVQNLQKTGVLIPMAVPSDSGKDNVVLDLGTYTRYIIQYLTSITDNLQSQINAINNKGGGTSPGGGGGSSVDLTTVIEAVNNLNGRVQTLETSSTWPTHYITLRKNGVDIPYALPTSPGSRGVPRGEIIVESNTATLPNFYVVVTIGNTTVTGTTAKIEATVQIRNYYDANVLLNGGQIGNVILTGSLQTSDGAVFSLNGTKAGTKNLSAGSVGQDYENVVFNDTNNSVLTVSVPSGSTIQKVSINCQVNGVNLSGVAEAVGGTKVEGTGYITLSNS